MIVPVMAISNLVLTRQIYTEETNGAHAHYREPVPLNVVNDFFKNYEAFEELYQALHSVFHPFTRCFKIILDKVGCASPRFQLTSQWENIGWNSTFHVWYCIVTVSWVGPLFEYFDFWNGLSTHEIPTSLYHLWRQWYCVFHGEFFCV